MDEEKGPVKDCKKTKILEDVERSFPSQMTEGFLVKGGGCSRGKTKCPWDEKKSARLLPSWPRVSVERRGRSLKKHQQKNWYQHALSRNL